MNAYQWEQSIFSHIDAPTPADSGWTDSDDRKKRYGIQNQSRNRNENKQYGQGNNRFSRY